MIVSKGALSALSTERDEPDDYPAVDLFLIRTKKTPIFLVFKHVFLDVLCFEFSIAR